MSDITAKSAAVMFAHLAPSPRYRSPSFAARPRSAAPFTRMPGITKPRMAFLAGRWSMSIDTVGYFRLNFRQLASFRSKDAFASSELQLMPAPAQMPLPHSSAANHRSPTTIMGFLYQVRQAAWSAFCTSSSAFSGIPG